MDFCQVLWILLPVLESPKFWWKSAKVLWYHDFFVGFCFCLYLLCAFAGICTRICIRCCVQMAIWGLSFSAQPAQLNSTRFKLRTLSSISSSLAVHPSTKMIMITSTRPPWSWSWSGLREAEKDWVGLRGAWSLVWVLWLFIWHTCLYVGDAYFFLRTDYLTNGRRYSMRSSRPVHFSYRHGRHGGGHKAVWGGTFDWWWYPLLSRVKQITQVFGGEIIKFDMWIILGLETSISA